MMNDDKTPTRSTLEIQAIDGCLVIKIIWLESGTELTHQFDEGEMIELTVSEIQEMRINGHD